ncbi:Cytochrome b-c1 complex subunit 7 [Metarhizium acridum]|nr:Cytochrome b-c1 complex subunit 7 [Metarhizium acridum]
MSGYSLAPFILRRPWLANMVMPAANWYANAAGYKKLGLRYDDLVEEERESTQIALKRLSPKESYDRIYRIPPLRPVQLPAQAAPQGPVDKA